MDLNKYARSYSVATVATVADEVSTSVDDFSTPATKLEDDLNPNPESDDLPMGLTPTTS